MNSTYILGDLINILRYFELCYTLDIDKFEKEEVEYMYGLTQSLLDDVDINDSVFKNTLLLLEENIIYTIDIIEQSLIYNQNTNYSCFLKYLNNIDGIISYLKINVFLKIEV